MDDVGPVRGVACDDERLGQAQPDDLGAHLHDAGAYCEAICSM